MVDIIVQLKGLTIILSNDRIILLTERYKMTIQKATHFNEETKTMEYEKSTPKIWAQDFLMDLISQYNYRLEDRGVNNLDKMTKKEEEQCMDQLRKQADRIAKMFGYDKHWTT